MTRPKLTFANAIALIALFIALGGTVYAAAKINGRTIRKGSIPADRLKADSLTGLEINEQLLGTVPSAMRASTVPRAAQAGRAPSAARATRAANAEVAVSAGSAESAQRADRAGLAAQAGLVADVPALGGVPAENYLRKCAGQTVLAAVTVDINFQSKVPFVVDDREFNCAGPRIAIERLREGETIVTVPNVPAGTAIVSAEHGQDVASVEPQAGGRFRVNTVFVGFGAPEPDDIQYTLAIFGTAP
ncbi:MAG TPA: hypothetical protein VMS60_05020 [Solirubrobacterales bacterium]|nr:hypothetical protein [Solirubrobacterales bacterium]